MALIPPELIQDHLHLGKPLWRPMSKRRSRFRELRIFVLNIETPVCKGMLPKGVTREGLFVTLSHVLPTVELRARLNAMLRASIAGYVDAFSLLKMKIFTSFMSGNTTSTGMKTGEGRLGDALHDFLPIPCFVLGTFLGTLLQKERSAPSKFGASLSVVLLLLLSTGALLFAAPASLLVVLLAVAMGLLNTTVAKVAGQSVSSGFVTGDLKSLGEHLGNAFNRTPIQGGQGPWDTHLSRAATLGSVWVAFLVGGILGASTSIHLTAWTLVAPAAALLLVASLELRASKQGRAGSAQ